MTANEFHRILTCHNVGVSVLVLVLRLLRVLRSVLVQAGVGADLLVLLGKAHILEKLN